MDSPAGCEVFDIEGDLPVWWSAAGSRFAETMLTVIETCRQQHRNTFEYLTTAVKAHLAGQSAPSLLPGV